MPSSFGNRNARAYAKISRIRCPWDIAHVMGRGIERKEIFFNDTNRSDYTNRLADIVEEDAARKEDGYSGADVARYFGVTNSCVTRFVASGKKPDVDDLIRKL